MKITDLVPQKKDPNRVSVFLDGQFAFGLSQQIRFEQKLEIDGEIDQKTVTALVSQDQLNRLVERMLRFLSFRPRSEKEVSDHFLYKAKLKDLTVSEIELATYKKSIGKAIDKLKKLEQLNDTEFVSWWVGQRNRFKPKGVALLKVELLQKGISRELIDNFFEKSSNSSESDLESALRAIDKKLPSFQKLPSTDFKKKVTQFLLRRGFGWDVVNSVIDRTKPKS
ncbi:MAG: hypothetical protein A3F33_00685 [Candidatus Woykebacteria bacterium RIFCSPHIGHO2_12_FULL_43_10]|uniref:Regulatory protein RecX n=1 Tax=Candidatus Woykebacteria bacterium RIFCSPHIGHO2_02_FULL_43_16b TaxID=1802601 RepID=A0A1G1WPP1_9BACT|nr:MAG: hypothetical protein A3F33_00685 [Candidatus Woykebacteria bacterium RIFCSPHIGHO2_12_FULL_43_10]OGY29706.1 MAG: hypothetical protein A3J50_02065 [Candidatus Woykebacteria bacterium RIFCSPHIGHO2_02_FULL_43_16b]